MYGDEWAEVRGKERGKFQGYSRHVVRRDGNKEEGKRQ